MLVGQHYQNGYVCDDIEAALDMFRAAVDRQDLPVVMERDLGPEKLRFLYLDGRKMFGHYLEYTCMPDAIWHQLQSM